MKNPHLTKSLLNSRMLKNTGSWLYCDRCGKTVGYLCYSTFQSFDFAFTCKCGSSGAVKLSYQTDKTITDSPAALRVRKNRLCCTNDDAPLFSLVDKHIDSYAYVAVCNSCWNRYRGQSICK